VIRTLKQKVIDSLGSNTGLYCHRVRMSAPILGGQDPSCFGKMDFRLSESVLVIPPSPAWSFRMIHLGYQYRLIWLMLRTPVAHFVHISPIGAGVHHFSLYARLPSKSPRSLSYSTSITSALYYPHRTSCVHKSRFFPIRPLSAVARMTGKPTLRYVDVSGES
jgi:hypothetical protein